MLILSPSIYTHTCYAFQLEYIDGMVWANVWQTDCVAIIDPKDGLVHGWVLLQGLKHKAAKETGTRPWQMDVLNGGAFSRQRCYVEMTRSCFRYRIRRRE